MLSEGDKHLIKLQTLTGLDQVELNEIITLITGRINLICEEFIYRDWRTFIDTVYSLTRHRSNP